MMKVPNDFYHQFEELNYKLDALLEENKTLKTNKQSETKIVRELKKQYSEEMKRLKKELKQEFKQEKADFKATISNIETTIQAKDETIQKLLNEIDRLKNQINKNSSNSSKPSSTDIGRPKKSGANLYNSRKATTKKIGGQKGHRGHGLTKEKVEKLIKENNIKTKVIYHNSNNRSKKDVIKYRIGLETKVYVEKHIFKHNENSDNQIPKEFQTDVTYDNSIKALTIELGTYNVIAYDRLSDFFNVLSNGVIKISNGTLVNFLKEFSNKSKSSIDNLENNLLNQDIMNTDETTNDRWYIRNYSNKETVLYKPHKRKGHKQIEEHNILPKYTGAIIHDHGTAMYKYGHKNIECIVHLGRYLEELIQNIKEITWPKKLKELLFQTNHERKEIVNKNITMFSNYQIYNIENEYDDFIKLAKKENQNINSKFYKEKAMKLTRRCEKYKENHLAYIYDFNIPFDNNLSERDLRIIKTKTKISGGFRSEHGAQIYCDVISIIRTAKKRGINPFQAILDIFNNKELFV